MPEAHPPRRPRHPSAPVVDSRTRHCELVDLMAAGLERVVLAPESADISAPKESRGDGLELPRHAALSVSARFPGSERRGPNGFKRGESA
jgi:hypothetical protein